VAVPATGGDPAELVAERTGAPVLFVDLDRSDDPLRVSRALVPGLRPWRPRFARGRLEAVPRRLGWRRDPPQTVTGDDVILI
jgi:ribosomal protein S12 methylthiotransferase accessory factor